MVVVKAYFGNGNFKDVKLSQSIERSGDFMVTDTDKLEVSLSRSRERSSDAIAVCDWQEGILTLFANGRFTAKIWLTKQNISGSWEYF